MDQLDIGTSYDTSEMFGSRKEIWIAWDRRVFSMSRISYRFIQSICKKEKRKIG
jgi:hypothetical protein